MWYVRNQGNRQQRPQLLQLRHNGGLWRFGILHAAWAQYRSEDASKSAPHSHDVYHIVFYVQGENEFRLRGQREKAQAGTLILASPGESHDFGPTRPGAVVYHELTFALEKGNRSLRLPFHRLLSLYCGRRLPEVTWPVRVNQGQFRRIEFLFRRMLESLTEPRDVELGSFIAHQAAMEMLSYLVQEFYAPTLTSSPTDSLTAIRRQIQQGYTQGLDLKTLARQAQLSEGYLCRAFRARFGLPPIAYQLNLRLAAAQSLLRASNLQCKEIARRLGFADVYCFSKAFKKYNGCSPAAFRERKADGAFSAGEGLADRISRVKC